MVFGENESYNDNQDGVVDHHEETIPEIEEIETEEVEEVEEVETEEVEELEGIEEEIEELEENSEDGEVADLQESEQTQEENKIYKRMRLKAEKEASQKLESERLKIETERKELLALRQAKEAQEAEINIYNNIMTEDNINQVEIENDVSREVAQKLLQGEIDKLVADEKNKVSQRYNLIVNQKDKLRKHKFYNLIEKDVENIVENNPNLDFATAFKFMVGDRLEELESKVSKSKSKSNIANTQDVRRRKTIKSNNSSLNDIDPKAVLSKNGYDMALVFGNDPKEVAQWKKTQTSKRKKLK